MTATSRRLIVAVAAVPTLLSAACGVTTTERPPTSGAEPRPSERVLDLEFSTTAPQVTNRGTATVDTEIVTLDDGDLRFVPGRGGRIALSFPVYSGAATYPRAVLRVDAQDGASDPFSPGARDFTFGASFKLDELSTGTEVDNGDNLIQRGTSGQATLMKLEIDGLKAACTLRAEGDELRVVGRESVQPGRWYSVRCERDGDRVGVTLTSAGESPGQATTTWGEGFSGSLDFDPSVGLAIGGKIGADGQLIGDATDQFNGLVTAPTLDIRVP